MSKDESLILIKLFGITFIFIAIFAGCSFLNEKLRMEDDHPIEEFFEEVLEEQIGVDIDFTPETPE